MDSSKIAPEVDQTSKPGLVVWLGLCTILAFQTSPTTSKAIDGIHDGIEVLK